MRDRNYDEEDLEKESLKAEILKLRARVSELEDWFARCTCNAAGRAGRDLATSKQLRYIKGLSSKGEIDAGNLALEKFGVAALHELSAEQASQLIDLLKQQSKK